MLLCGSWRSVARKLKTRSLLLSTRGTPGRMHRNGFAFTRMSLGSAGLLHVSPTRMQRADASASHCAHPPLSHSPPAGGRQSSRKLGWGQGSRRRAGGWHGSDWGREWMHLPLGAALAVLAAHNQADCAAGRKGGFAMGSRSRVLSTPQQVQKIAALINALVDMEYWTEEEEQQIFEHAVQMVLEVIEKMLPRPILLLVVQSDEYDGLDEEAAEVLRNRLVEYCKWKLKLPFLDETDEIRVITAVCAVIVESLKKGNSFNNVVEPVNSGELLIDVFVKGSVGLLDEQNKQEFIRTISDSLQIPFLPDAPKVWVVGKMMTEVAMVFEESLLFSYQKRIQAAYDWAAERVGEARKSDEFIRLRSKIPHAGMGAGILAYLFGQAPRATPEDYVREIPIFDEGRLWKRQDLVLPQGDGVKFGEEVRDLLVNSLNDRINVIGWVCDMFERWEGVLIQKIVDITLLESMDMDKMDSSISFLCRENFAYALGYEWFECLKEEQLPYPAGWKQNEWYWALAKELAKRDIGRICIDNPEDGMDPGGNGAPKILRRVTSSAPKVSVEYAKVVYDDGKEDEQGDK